MKSKKILVIDDAEFILESTATLLRFEGYEVFTASNGVAGVEEALMVRPDLILCDISMPGLDGYEVLERLRNEPTTATTPFIFLTAFTEKKNMRAGMEKGADDYIVKPYTRNEIIAAIDAQWAKHSLIEKQVQEKVDQVGRNVTYALPHEFRTVLNEVMNSAKYLKQAADNVEPEEIIEITDDIVSSSKRLLKITESFLFYVSIESLVSNPEKRRHLRKFATEEPCAMIDDIASLTSDRYSRRNDLQLEGMVEGLSVEMSTESFHKIINELFDNAFRFSSAGAKILIQVKFEHKFLHVSIKDQGRGMSKEQISRIAALAQFDRTLYEQQGVGLGLIVSKKLVELHDGKFEVESEEGKGTTVRFTLPCKAIS